MLAVKPTDINLIIVNLTKTLFKGGLENYYIVSAVTFRRAAAVKKLAVLSDALILSYLLALPTGGQAAKMP